MRLWTTVLEALDALRTHTLRTALTMLGIIIGVAAVVAMVSIGTGAQRRIEAQIRSMGANLVMVLSGTATSGGLRMGMGSQLTLTEEDARAIALEIPAVEAAAPSVRGTAQTVYGHLNWSTVIQGATPDEIIVREWRLAAGRMFDAQDVLAAAKVAVLGDTVARSLFTGVDPVGETIRIKKVPFTVVGVLAPKGQSAIGMDQDDLIMIPISTAKTKVLGAAQANPRAVGAIAVRVRDPALVEEAQSQMRDLLRQRHRLGPAQEDDFSTRALADLFAAREESARVMTLLLAAVASVSLLVGGIGIMNIMLVSVTERTREIGLRMAIGARARDILTQFLVEALTLSVVGGVVGIGVGLVGSRVVAAVAGWGTDVSPGAIALAFTFAAAVGVFFGFYPAHKASRLEPIDALRYE
jgi:putative ABC transport system permease protein